MGPGNGKFQVSFGWRQAYADRSYHGTSYNRTFTDNWQPKMRLTLLDVSARYNFNSRVSVLASMPIALNSYSQLFPPKGSAKGLRAGWNVDGIGDLVIQPQVLCLHPKEHPYENVVLGLGIKVPTGNWDEKRNIPNLNGQFLGRTTVYPQAVMPGDGGTGIVASMDAFKTFRAPKLVRGQTVFLSGSYLVNPRNTNGASSIISSAGVPLTPNFLNELSNSVADAYSVQAGCALKIPGTWNKPNFKGLRARAVYRWEGVRAHDLIGPAGGFRQPGWAMSIGPGVTWARNRDLLMVDVPITFLRYINAERSAVPGPSNGSQPAAFNPARNLGLVAPVSIAVRYVRSF
jgi:hypothetical protein